MADGRMQREMQRSTVKLSNGKMHCETGELTVKLIKLQSINRHSRSTKYLTTKIIFNLQ